MEHAEARTWEDSKEKAHFSAFPTPSNLKDLLHPLFRCHASRCGQIRSEVPAGNFRSLAFCLQCRQNHEQALLRTLRGTASKTVPIRVTVTVVG